MTKLELKELLNEYVSKYPSSYTKKLIERGDYDAVIRDLFAYTSKLTSPYIKIKTRIYLVINDLESAPRCLNDKCGRVMLDKNIRNMRDGYPLHCCGQCAKESSHRKSLYELACESKYGKGITNASKADEVKLKKETSALAHYGVRNPMQADSVKAEVANTNICTYGSACPLGNAKVHAKAVDSCITNWGVDSFSKTDMFIEKTTSSNRRNFGVDYPNQDPEIRRRAQKRYSYNGINFDSAPELAFFIWSSDHGEDVIYQPDVSFEYFARGRTFVYQPDFVARGEYLEIKGNQFFEGGDPASGKMINPYDRSQDDIYEAKYKCMLANGVIIMTADRYAPYMEYMKKTYGKNWKDVYRRT